MAGSETSGAAVIIGAGQAGAQAAQSLRTEGFKGPIVMIGDEAYPPYQRPPLSKKFLAGELEEERLFLRPQAFYDEAKITLRLNTRATAIDREAHTVSLEGGEKLTYAKLLIATGTRVRRLTCPGSHLKGICDLRNIDDVRRIQPEFTPGKRMVIVGGGYIGLEVAAVAVKRGLKVTVLEMADRVMARAVSETLSRYYEDFHRKAGVDLRLGEPVAAVEGDDHVRAVATASGPIPADLVLVGIGVIPNVELAAEAGLACDNGILVDEHARTADPDVFAAGDCTNHPCAIAGRRLRLESVQNAIEQAKAAAAGMAGKPRVYAEVPWFWSDQYELKMQIAGLAEPGDTQILRGDPASGKFAVFYLRGGVVAAVESVNAAPEFMMGRQMIAKHLAVAPDRLADVNIPMKQLIS
ncbi:MAG: NAD(P)-binding protein [Alphaproteobacteria bacterium]|nr:NAD(P)-binding protein [Alphaproteobacteria bacterium]